MTIERILKKKLKTFLKESFPGSDVTNNLESRLALPSIVEILEKPFRLSVFTITTTDDAHPEDFLSLCEQYYFERCWLKQDEKIFAIKHNGLDMSFERDGEKMFLILSPFEKFIKITIIRFKEKNYGKKTN